jgi:AraC family transcriptional regulator
LVADKALWVIERNSERSLTLNGIARACGVSRSHLAHAFGSATGVPVIAYLRARRLSQAAHALAQGASDILAVALDAGYGSHEAFTRAFRDQFSTTPERVREQRSVAGLTMVAPLTLRPRGSTSLATPRFEQMDSVLIVGHSELCSFETTITIPAHWQRFMAYYEAILHKAHPIPVGVSQVPDEDGRFQYLCGVEVTRFGDTPAELQILAIAARRYAVFEHTTHVSALYQTYAAIWNEALPALGCAVADAPVLERHNPTFDPRTGEGGLSVWIPLARLPNTANRS